MKTLWKSPQRHPNPEAVMMGDHEVDFGVGEDTARREGGGGGP